MILVVYFLIAVGLSCLAALTGVAVEEAANKAKANPKLNKFFSWIFLTGFFDKFTHWFDQFTDKMASIWRIIKALFVLLIVTGIIYVVYLLFKVVF